MSQGDEANRIPNWLRQMQGWENTPEWLLHLVEKDRGGSLSSAETEDLLSKVGFGTDERVSFEEGVEREGAEEEIEAFPGTRDASGWMAELDEGAQTEIQVPPLEMDEEMSSAADIAEPGEEVVPDWLAGLEDGTWREGDAAAPGEEEAPDWLSRLEETSLSGVELSAPGKEMAPDGASGLEDAAPAEAESPAAVPPGGLPDWLTQGGGTAGEAEIAVQGEEAVPEWLASLEETAPTALGEQGVTDWLSRLEETAPAAPDEGEAPDWLSALEEAAPADTGPLVSTSTEDMPEWLADLEEMAPAAPDKEAAPDWLSSLEEAAPADTGPLVPASAEGATRLETGPLVPASPEAAVPDWLDSTEGVASIEPELSVSAAEGLPDWLMGLDEGAPTKVEVAAPGKEAETDRLPGPADETPVEAKPPADGLAEIGEGAPAQVIPLSAEEAVPDWLAALEHGAPEKDEAAAQVDSSEGVPDWLAGMDAGEIGETSGAEIPEWLVGIDEGLPGEAEPVADVETQGGFEPTAAASEGEETTPSWLETMGEIQSESEPLATKGVTAWLQDVQNTVVPHPVSETSEQEPRPEWIQDSEPAADGETTGSVPSQTPALGESLLDTPSWMQDLYTMEDQPSVVQDVLALPSREDLPIGETPAWVEELRDKPVEPPEKVLPVETSGPLAGLRGVLNPEPLLAILPKSTYKPVLPITEADQAGIKLVEQVLAAPVSHPIRSRRSPGREIMASLGRWMLYLALVAMILVSPLQEWVRLPEQLETSSFFNTVEGVLPGSEVLVVVDYDASLDGELTPQARAIIWHLLHRNLGIVAVSLTPQGVVIVDDLLGENPSAVAGEHYVNLGYIPAHPAALQAFMNNPLGGATISSIAQDPIHTSLGQRIRQFEDLDLIVTVSGDQDHVRWWIEQVGSQTQIDILASVPLGVAPYIQPYYSESGNGQLKGVLAGLGATAKYEELSDAGFVPSAQLNYIVQANAQMLLALVVLVSGIGSLVVGSRGKRTSSDPVSKARIGGDE